MMKTTTTTTPSIRLPPPPPPRPSLSPSTIPSAISMQRSSLLSPPRLPPPLFSARRSFLRSPAVIRRPPISAHRRPRVRLLPLFVSRSAATVAAAEAVPRPGGGDVRDTNFVEVGYISSTHGVKGELLVVPMTDFPELRFCKPGTRWLSTRISGKVLISEVQLTGGRGHQGQKSWIVRFGGVDTVEKAKQIVGSTLLVNETDRPELEEGEFYTRDLVGMRVVLKESGTLFGIVSNVVNYGASDLLRVVPANKNNQDPLSSSKLDSDFSGQHVWLPFVEAIVPDVDMDKREMLITPPKGLLELNLRSDTRTKKERRHLEWKERKKIQLRVAKAKKELAEMSQTHVLEGLKIGNKAQKNLLGRQIANLDLKLLQHAMHSIGEPSNSFSELVNANSATFLKSSMRVSQDYLTSCASEEKEDLNNLLHEEGLQLLSKCKAAIVLIINETGHDSEFSATSGGLSETSVRQFEDSLLQCNRFLKVKEQDRTVPLIVVSPAHLIQQYQECSSENNYFGLNSQQVWFLEQLQLPIVSMPVDQNGCKILLKSSWEILQASIGSGGLFKLLLSNNIMTELNNIGVEYVQVCNLNNKATIGHPLFFGLVSSRRADVGIKIFENHKGEDEFDMIFSTRHLNKITRQIDKLRFHAVPEHTLHVGQEQMESLAKIHPDAPNSYRFHCSIYDNSLDSCSLDSLSVMRVFE